MKHLSLGFQVALLQEHIQEDTSHRQQQLAAFYVSEYIGLCYLTPLVSINLARQIFPEIHSNTLILGF